jgi:hypothetical protein
MKTQLKILILTGLALAAAGGMARVFQRTVRPGPVAGAEKAFSTELRINGKRKALNLFSVAVPSHQVLQNRLHARYAGAETAAFGNGYFYGGHGRGVNYAAFSPPELRRSLLFSLEPVPERVERRSALQKMLDQIPLMNGAVYGSEVEDLRGGYGLKMVHVSACPPDEIRAWYAAWLRRTGWSPAAAALPPTDSAADIYVRGKLVCCVGVRYRDASVPAVAVFLVHETDGVRR